ncbi:hypothetical protein [Roseateles sp. BYS87W]|uniref:Uncharacterized protein n=1 Tax=Pelomonas baiyunensis TaxID=3299026 RepID=A0ABW7GUL5_9BURK
MPLPPSSGPTRPPPPRLLASSGDDTRDRSRMGARVRTRDADDTTFTATQPFSRPQVRLAGGAAATLPPSTPLPVWARRLAIGGVLLAMAMPATVLMSRSMLVQEALSEQSASNAVMRCTAGEARSFDDSNVFSWLFSGAYFSCGDWETRDARIQRDRDRAQANYLARERARQGY